MMKPITVSLGDTLTLLIGCIAGVSLGQWLGWGWNPIGRPMVTSAEDIRK